MDNANGNNGTASTSTGSGIRTGHRTSAGTASNKCNNNDNNNNNCKCNNNENKNKKATKKGGEYKRTYDFTIRNWPLYDDEDDTDEENDDNDDGNDDEDELSYNSFFLDYYQDEGIQPYFYLSKREFDSSHYDPIMAGRMASIKRYDTEVIEAIYKEGFYYDYQEGKDESEKKKKWQTLPQARKIR